MRPPLHEIRVGDVYFDNIGWSRRIVSIDHEDPRFGRYIFYKTTIGGTGVENEFLSGITYICMRNWINKQLNRGAKQPILSHGVMYSTQVS